MRAMQAGQCKARNLKKISAKSMSLVCLLLLIAVLPTGTRAEHMGTAIISSSGAIIFTPSLHVEGKYIKDELGNIVFLRGVNKDGFNYDWSGWWTPVDKTWQWGYESWSADAAKANLDSMQSLGFNAIRLFFDMEFWMNDTQNYRQHVKDTINWSDQRGLYVILTLVSIHQEFPYPPLPFQPYIGMSPWNYTDPIQVEDWVEFWRGVVQETRQYGNILYELWNEPHEVAYGTYADLPVWINAVQQAIEAIRALTDRIVLVQWGYGIGVGYFGGQYQTNYDLSWIEEYPLNGTNIVYSTHIYRFHDSLGQDKPYNYTVIEQRLIDAKIPYVVESLGKPVIIGETGANIWYTDTDLEQELTYFKNLLSISNEWDLNYLGFQWFASIRRFGLLQSLAFVPPPNAAGQILVDAVSEGSI